MPEIRVRVYLCLDKFIILSLTNRQIKSQGASIKPISLTRSLGSFITNDFENQDLECVITNNNQDTSIQRKIIQTYLI